MAVPGEQNLESFIDKSGIECLNEDTKHPANNAIFDPSDGTFLQSDPDVDHTLLIKLKFNQPVKLSGIRIKANSEDETAPQSCKIFKEAPHMGFGEAEDGGEVQTITFAPEDVDQGKAMPLRFVKFQSVSSLQIFIGENFGADTTRINHIEFLGLPAQNMDMSQFKPVKG
eukprot:gnl/MRDRNA2_/MRDRNA2_117767_c0_seq1.p1 gnl/MRDRNA2_/MRDRNA2_117767_c0~~gnl/MRDRNA2_/MRDRNA2_117767_c0_seq1.p1  ORF type:complete len:170 (+),score=35.46 gnl/MRDRNA2_/MRDRNA2_117767_c0_seq1:123-632(+)